jgi:methyl acetate hydrolase
MGGAGLTSTLPDYLKFLNDIISDSPRILSKATIDEYVKKNQLKEGVKVVALPAVYPFSDKRAFIPGEDIGHVSTTRSFSWDFEANPGLFQSMAAAISLDQVPGMRPVGSLAWAGLCNSYFFADPTSNVAAVIAAQILPFTDAKVIPLWQELEKIVYA